jgi:VPDSG-CTERM motif
MNCFPLHRRIAFYGILLLIPIWAHALLIQSATGPTAASITGARDAFRLDLGGGIVAGANGSFGGLRREINWDGVPDPFSAPNNMPADFFNVNSPRGAVFATPGTGFQVSANAGIAPVQFDNIDPTYSQTFEPFSPQRLFTSLGSNIVDVNFFLPGTNTPALTNGFGAVFGDVDLADTTSIQLFDKSSNSLWTFFVPATAGSETFSFLGISFADPVIARVRITSGTFAVGAGVTDQNGDLRDVVTMDDFLYGEPRPTPDVGSTILLLGFALIGVYALRRKLQVTDFRKA